MFERFHDRNTSHETDHRENVTRLSAANVKESSTDGAKRFEWFVCKHMILVEESETVEGKDEKGRHQVGGC